MVGLGSRALALDPAQPAANYLRTAFTSEDGLISNTVNATLQTVCDDPDPNLRRHSKSPEGERLPDYVEKTNRRFEQWILNSCLRPYDQDWINDQEEISLRHASLKTNQVDGVRSTPYVPLREIDAFIAVMNETIHPYLAA